MSILITGATGLIGKNLVRRILDKETEIYIVVRSEKKAKDVLKNDFGRVKVLMSDIRTVDLSNINVDYIIHAASQTSSQAFIKEPVETISVAFDGTKHLLDFARTQKNLKRFIYLSTMEVYGTPSTDDKISEKNGTNLDTMNVRSCYPESKRMCENLCVSYASEYGIPINVLRLTQTFGPGVQYDDKRVFAEFARCAIEGKDIILKTKGETKRSYLYTEDAIDAILTVLQKAPTNEAYNVANEETYCSIYDMAQMVAKDIAGGRIQVRIEENEDVNRGFAPTLHMNLDCTKMRKLGWEPTVGLEGMYRYMITYMREHKSK